MRITLCISCLLLAVAARDAQAQPTPAAPAEASAEGKPAPGAAAPRAVVLHVPPLSSDGKDGIELSAMIDAPFAEELSVRWRPLGAVTWQDVAFERAAGDGGWYARLPAVAPPGLEYYLRGRDAFGAEIVHFASAQAPHVVQVAPSLVDRLEDLDRRRLGDRQNQVSFDVMGHNFGNRYGLPDRFFRGELVFTHRLWRVLYHLSFGYGSIWGKTPEASTPAVHNAYLTHGLRYGFGEVRLRFHPSVFVDLRAALGVSHIGFDPALRGVITLGKPWRSSVNIGGELSEDVGHSAWVRLQWDTVPPLLMGASIVRTNLPGVEISSSGLYVAYDVSYVIADRFTVRGQVSYGARDGAANVGGGLGTVVEF
ncbi:MAG: hypothetical protein IPI49_13015 [Myxococcales bacterium]|nr:hypothetical protein [Myxococcales bacterium]HRC59136.1 hypothetical protein [Kofleriaceae bacterium]